MKRDTGQKSSPFLRKKTAFLSGTSNFFGPSYFEAALANDDDVVPNKPCRNEKGPKKNKIFYTFI